MDEKRKILREIFMQHQLPDDWKKIWFAELSKFTAQQIETAYAEWSNANKNNNCRPSVVEIKKLIEINSKNFFKHQPQNKHVDNSLRRGRSFTEDLLISKLDAAYRNMPELDKNLKSCASVVEKLAICAAAAGDDCIGNNFVQSLLKRLSHQESA